MLRNPLMVARIFFASVGKGTKFGRRMYEVPVSKGTKFGRQRYEVVANSTNRSNWSPIERNGWRDERIGRPWSANVRNGR